MSESANSAKSAKQIFANFVKFVKFVKSIFGTTRRSVGSVSLAEYLTNYQRISNLSLTIRPFRVAILAVLLLFVGGWNNEVWAQTEKKSTFTLQTVSTEKKAESTKGKVTITYGQFTNTQGIDEVSLNYYSTTNKPLFVTYEAEKMYLQYTTDGSNWHDVGELSIQNNSYASSATKFTIGPNHGAFWAKQFRVVTKSTSTLKYSYYVKDFKVTSSRYLKISSESLPFGDLDYENANVTTTAKVTFAQRNLQNDVQLVLSSSEFSIINPTNTTITKTVGGETSTEVTVQFNPTSAGSKSATLKIWDGTNTYSLSVTLSGNAKKLDQDVTFPTSQLSLGEEILSSDVTTSSGNIPTFSSSNTTNIRVEDNYKITGIAAGTANVSVHVEGNDYYNAYDGSKSLTITNLLTTYIDWDQAKELTRLTTAMSTFDLDAVVRSRVSNTATGKTVNYTSSNTSVVSVSGSKLTIKGKGTCTLTATSTTDATYLAPEPVVLNVRVRIIGEECTDYPIASQSGQKSLNTIEEGNAINFSAPAYQVTLEARKNTSIAINGFYVQETKDGSNWTDLGNPSLSTDYQRYTYNLSRNAKAVRCITKLGATFVKYYRNVVVTQAAYLESDISSISVDAAYEEEIKRSVVISYSNLPGTLEPSLQNGQHVTIVNAAEFGGDCGDYGTHTIQLKLKSTQVGKVTDKLIITGPNSWKLEIPITINTGKMNNAISHNVVKKYLTTDKVIIAPTANSGSNSFKYTLSNNDGVAQISGTTLTFLKSGTFDLTIDQAESAEYKKATASITNIQVSKATPTLETPTSGTEIQYLQTLSNSAIANDGVAKVTLLGVENTVVAGTWAWSNPTQVIKDNAGTHAYEVTFTPTDGGMYTTNTCMVPVTILRAAQAITMNNGIVKVAVDGNDAGKADSKIDLDNLIASQTSDIVNSVQRAGVVTYEVISANKANATIGEGNVFSATVIGDYTIRATKAETGFYNAATADFTVSVTKRANTMVTAGPYTKYVDEEVLNVATVVNSDGEIHTSSTDATIAYYDVANNKIVIPNSEAKSFDQTEVTIKIWQDGTTRFEGIAEADAKTITLTVKKYDNPFACSWGAWTYTANFEDVVPVEFTTANTDYAHFPIVITQTSGENVATLVNNDATHNTITASYVRDNATWHLSQAESYKYKAGAQDVTMLVRTLPATCYIFEDNSEHTFETGIGDFTGHYDSPIEISGPAKSISFEAKMSGGLAINKFIAEYSVDNCSSWRTIMEPDLDSEWGQTYTKNFSEIGLAENERVTHIRFGAQTGATYSKWYRNIKVTRATNIKPLDKENNLITAMTMPQNTAGGSTTEKFYMKFSSCDEVVKLASNNSHFTLDKVEIANDLSKDEVNAEVTVTYSSNEVGTHNGVITLYTKYQNRTFTVTGTTTKKVQTIDWKEGFTGDPLTLQKGLVVDNVNIAATASSERPVIYTTDNVDVIEIILNGLGFKVIGEGSATLTASEAGDDYWESVSEQKTIIATGKPVQTILWDQNLVSDLELEQEKELEAKVYIRDASTGDLTFNAERTALINYSCPVNDVISLEGNTITVIGYGQTTITAMVAGDAMYVEAQPVVVTVRVREPSAGCETPLVLDHPENMRLYSTDFIAAGLNYTTPQVVSQIDLDRTKGKPDKLSYKHNGELASIPVFGAIKLCGGAVKVQERVNGSWNDVEGSYFDNEGKTGNKADYNWRDVMDLQLNENADAIRFVRLEHGSGAHNFKDIQITLLQYVRPVQAIIEAENVLDLGDIEVGEAHAAVVSFDYSDVKGEILATKGNTEDAVLVLNEKTVYLTCGSHGQYDLPITLQPTEEGEWSNTVTLTDRLTNVATTITVRANVVPGKKYTFNGGEGGNSTQWGTTTNWKDNEKPGADDNVIIRSDVEITGDVTVGSLTIDEGVTVTVTVTGNLTIGDGSSYLQAGYGDLHVADGGSVTLGSGAVMVRDFILDASLGDAADQHAASGQFNDESNKMYLNRAAYFDLAFDPSGKIGFGWYDFTVPFTVNISNGISRIGTTDDRQMVHGVDFMVMEADEANRANGGRGWRNVSGGVLQPGKLYTITFDYQESFDQNTFRFKWNGNGTLANGATANTQYTEGSEETLRGWNGLGNGMLRHGYVNSGYKMQAYSHTSNTYELVEGSKTFAVGSAFFIQVPVAGTIDWTKAEATNARPMYAPQREAREVEEFRLTLNQNEKKADVLYFSASEDATEAYVIGRDLLKMGTPAESKVARMWATKGGKNLCDVEAEMVNNNANTPLTLFAPQAGSYELRIEEMPEDATLYLTYNGSPIWNLNNAPYMFELEKGTTEGYGLRIYAHNAPQIATGVEEAASEKEAARKVLIDEKIYIITPQGAMYDITGKFVK